MINNFRISRVFIHSTFIISFFLILPSCSILGNDSAETKMSPLITGNRTEPIELKKNVLREGIVSDIAREVTVKIESVNSASGVIIGKKKGFFTNTYYVLTAKHAIQNTKLKVVMPDSEVVLTDAKHALQCFANTEKTVISQKSAIRCSANSDLALIEIKTRKNYQVANLNNFPIQNRSDFFDGDSDLSILISGFPDPSQNPGNNDIDGNIFISPGTLYNELDSLFLLDSEGFLSRTKSYNYVYSGSLTYRGMSGGPVFDSAGGLVALHVASEGVESGTYGQLALQFGIGISTEKILSFLEEAGLEISTKVINSYKPKKDTSLSLYKSDQERFEIWAKNETALCSDTKDSNKKECVNAAVKLIRLGMYSPALTILERLSIQNPNDKIVWYLYAKALAVTPGTKIKSIEAFDKVISIDPSFYPAWTKKCNSIRYVLKDSEKALHCWDYVIKNVKENSFFAWHTKGEIFNRTGTYEYSAKAFEQAIKIFPNAHSYNNQCVAYANQGETRKAVSSCDGAISVNPLFTPAYLNRYSLYISMGNSEKAHNSCVSGVIANSEYMNENLLSVVTQSDIEPILRCYSDAENQNQEDAYINFGKGLLLSKLEDFENSYNEFSKAIKKFPHSIAFYKERAISSFSRDLDEKAEEDLIYATTKLAPETKQEFLALAESYLLLDKSEKAIELYTSFIDRYGSLRSIRFIAGGSADEEAIVSAHLQLSQTLCMTKGKEKQGLTIIEDYKTIEKEEKSQKLLPLSNYILGLCRYVSNNYEGAKIALDEYIDIYSILLRNNRVSVNSNLINAYLMRADIVFSKQKLLVSTDQNDNVISIMYQDKLDEKIISDLKEAIKLTSIIKSEHFEIKLNNIIDHYISSFSNEKVQETQESKDALEILRKLKIEGKSI